MSQVLEDTQSKASSMSPDKKKLLDRISDYHEKQHHEEEIRDYLTHIRRQDKKLSEKII